jgi:hypothetical protein
MNTREQGVIHQAVVFFDGEKLVKEMLQVEFEAVLDQVVGLPEFAGRQMCACFLRINQRLQIDGAVFFLAEFDERGYVDRSWNVPLQHLLDNAGRGPDLGGGRIRLACRSQCSVPWHARQLWDPILEGENNSLRQMQQAVKRNRLGLTVDVPDLHDEQSNQPPLLHKTAGDNKGHERAAESERQITERVSNRLQQEYRSKISALQEEQQLQIATLKSALQEQIDQVHQHYQLQIGQFKEALVSTKQLFKDEKRRTLQLKEKLALQLGEFQRVREASQQAAVAERDQEHAKLQQTQVQQLQQQFDVELTARIEQASAELKEMLEMREVELFYREEQLGTLRDEIARLRQERERSITQGGDNVLQQLVENGVAFVAYQPGIEALSIPLLDIPRYLDAPLVYVADKSAVTLDQYQRWLNHRELPVCSAVLSGEAICGEPIDKIERPHQFIAGVSDRCGQHGNMQNTSTIDAQDSSTAPQASIY